MASSMLLSTTSTDQVVQAALVGAADVHARPAAHRLEAFQDLDLFGPVGLLQSLFLQKREPPFQRCDPQLL